MKILSYFTKLISMLLVLAVMWVIPINSQEGGEGESGADGDSDELLDRGTRPSFRRPGPIIRIPSPNIRLPGSILRVPGSAGITDNDTNLIVNNLFFGTDNCIFLPEEYRADCLGQQLKEASTVVRKSGYRDANRELNNASKKISRLVSRNEDKSARKIRRNGKTYRAVKKSAVAKVNRRTEKIVSETSTKLLRSAGNSALKKVHYARIAKAVDSTKVLIRSG